MSLFRQLTDGGCTARISFPRLAMLCLGTAVFLVNKSSLAQVEDGPVPSIVDSVDGGQEKSKAAESQDERDLSQYKQKIQPLLKQACFDCHSGDDVEGNFRADQHDPDLVNGPDIQWWLEVYSVVSKGEMPPDSESLPDEQRNPTKGTEPEVSNGSKTTPKEILKTASSPTLRAKIVLELRPTPQTQMRIPKPEPRYRLKA